MGQILYLNNNGSRWMVTGENEMNFVLVLPNGSKKTLKAEFYESFGNFATTHYRYKGKRYMALAKAHDGSEIRDESAAGLDALPHIWLEKSKAKQSL